MKEVWVWRTEKQHGTMTIDRDANTAEYAVLRTRFRRSRDVMLLRVEDADEIIARHAVNRLTGKPTYSKLERVS